MSAPDMTSDEFVKIAFNSAELNLDIELLEAIGIVVHGQVQTLLEMYTPRGGDRSAFPVQVATMLARAIGPLQNNVRSIKERVKELWGPLLLMEEKPPTYLRSILDQAMLATDMRQISRNSVLPRIKAILGAIDTSCPDPIAYLMSIGFDEHSADTLFNGAKCKDIFSLFIIVLLYRFVESLPQPRGTQSLTGVPIASEGHDRPTVQFDLTEGTTALSVTEQVAALRLEMLQMMRDMQTAMMTQMNTHLGTTRGTLPGGSTANVHASTFERLEDSLQPDLPFEQAIQGGDSGLALLNRGIGSLNAGTTHVPSVPNLAQNTSLGQGLSPTTSPAIDDALRQLLANFQRGQDHMSPNDILMTILRSPGLFVIGIAHIVCTFSRPPAKHHSASNAMVVSVIYNPDNLSYLNSLPHKAKQFHHWPTSPDAFFESLNRELLFSQETTAVGYKTIPGYTVTQSNSIHLSRYTRKMRQLFDSVLLGHTNSQVQSHAHHVTLYYLLLCFHYNMWTRAVVNKDLGLLLEAFDSVWTLFYAPSMGTNASGATNIRLNTAMQALSYCCEQCYRTGSCIQLCTTAECRTQTGHKGPAAPAPGNSTGFMKAFNAWKAQPANKGKTDQAFRLTDEFKALPPAPPKAAKSVIPTFDSLQHRQNEIKIPVHFELSY